MRRSCCTTRAYCPKDIATSDTACPSLAQYQADALLEPGKLKVPVIKMTSTQRRFDLQ